MTKREHENEMHDVSGSPLGCEDIQAVLFDYMTRELGPSRSELVGEHMHKCSACQKAAAEIQETLDALQLVSEQTEHIPERLSEKRRRRVLLAYMHPVLDWIYRRHVFVSICVALAVVTLLFITLLSRSFKFKDPLDGAITVTIRSGQTPPPQADDDGGPR